MLKKLLPFMRPYKRNALLSPILMILETLMDVMIPYLMAFIIDRGIAQRDLGYVVKVGGWMILAALFGLLCGVVSTHHGARAGMGFAAELRRALFTKIQSFSFANLDHFTEGSLITRLTTDSTLLGQTAMMSLRMAWRAPLMLVLALFLSIAINAELALVFAVALPLLLLGMAIIMKKAAPLWEELQARLDRLNGRIQENLSAMRVVKSFVRQAHEKRRFKEYNDAWMDQGIRALSVMITLNPLLILIVNACIAAILWFGGQKMLAGEMQAGELLSFFQYVMQVMMSLMMLSFFFLQLSRAKVCAERALEVLDLEVELLSPKDGLTELEDASIEFCGLSFHYPGSRGEQLKDISFRIEAGQTIGIIGSTGSGKSSLVQLIPRLYDASSGTLKVGGADVRAYDLAALREQVAFVLQKNSLFSGTVRENMRWGRADADDETIRLALERAQAADFIFAHAEGLDYQVEAGGANFSGGQRQRLCIARALLKQPKILILDDSTSAVDMATDARLRASLKQASAGVTLLIIAQRIASVEKADKILVLDDGQISGFARHEDLLADNKIYQEVCESQRRGGIGA